ncbi:hypothetical protein ADIARSV_4107 [Arcticibacter svalbardensis MN12-7]|uniref:Transposase DDE domain-containing protein n=1 Tax=Arcticibacter svalbardensis MN12-7 TaxID=1150600 RepID=R9GM36_9SPHI|nr:hypothetical protein ADIARSV_4107 [Arcticibacter svalbardensis MN12-7]
MDLELQSLTPDTVTRERNPIKGKFGQAKTAYGLDNIKARLKETSESWIACIFMVLNLVKLAWELYFWLKIKNMNRHFSAMIEIHAKRLVKIMAGVSSIHQPLFLKVKIIPLI